MDGRVHSVQAGDRRVLPIEGTWNFRDAGGYPMALGGQMRPGLLYRSDSLENLTPRGQTELLALGLRTVCDLRMPNERRRAADRLAEQGRPALVHLPLYPVERLDPTPLGRAWGVLSGRYPLADAGAVVAESYRHIVRTQARQLGQVLELLSHEENLPILIHCRGGKDRTGLVVALVHRLLGVSPKDLMSDYLLTNRLAEANRRRLLRMLRWFTLFRVPEAELVSLLEARPEFLEGAVEVIAELSGGLEAYLVEQAGLTEEVLGKVKGNFGAGAAGCSGGGRS
jgi:protein-tyrosine phosphatase